MKTRNYTEMFNGMQCPQAHKQVCVTITVIIVTSAVCNQGVVPSAKGYSEQAKVKTFTPQ